MCVSWELLNESHHHAFKLSVELLKLGGEFLPVKTDEIPVIISISTTAEFTFSALPPTSGSVC